MFLEHHGLHVGQVHHHVNDGELQLGKFLGYFFDAGGLAKTNADDGAGTALSHAADRLLALGFVGDFERQVLLARFFLPFFDTGVSRFVEGLVELATHVEHDRGVRSHGLEAGSQRSGQQAHVHSSFDVHNVSQFPMRFKKTRLSM